MYRKCILLSEFRPVQVNTYMYIHVCSQIDTGSEFPVVLIAPNPACVIKQSVTTINQHSSLLWVEQFM